MSDQEPDGDTSAATESSWYARHPMLTATVLGLLAGAAVAGLDLGLGTPGRDWRGSMVLPAGLITVSVLLTLARVRRDPRLRADRLGLVLAAVVGVAFVVVGVSVIPGSTTVPRVLNGGFVVVLGLVLAVAAGIAAVRRPSAEAAVRRPSAEAAAHRPVALTSTADPRGEPDRDDPRRDGTIAYPSRPVQRGRRSDPPTGPATPGG